MRLFTTLASAAMFTVAYAGGYNTNTNQDAAYHRNFAREAATETDAAYSNPAGTVFMADGLHISFAAQAAFQTRDMESTFAAYGADSVRKFDGKAVAPFVPSLQAVYKKNNWAGFLNFAVPGGGGKAEFKNGVPLLEKNIAQIPASLNALGVKTTEYSAETSIKGQQFIFGLTVGGAYKFNEHLSAALAMRVCYASNKYEGEMKNVRINPNGKEMLASNFFAATAADYLDKAKQATAGADQYEAAAQQYKAGGAEAEAQAALTNATALREKAKQAEAAAKQMAETGEATKDGSLDCKQTGWGVSPIVGLDYKYGPVTLATRYEFKTKIKVKNETSTDFTGFYADGAEDRDDMPALWSLGMNCEMSKNVTLCTGYRYYFDKDAHFLNGSEKYIEHGTKELTFGVEWNASKLFMFSCSYMRTQFSYSDAFLRSNINFNNSSNNFGLGGRFNINEHLQVELGGFFTLYEDRDVISPAKGYNDTPFVGVDHFERTNFACAIGIDYHF